MPREDQPVRSQTTEQTWAEFFAEPVTWGALTWAAIVGTLTWWTLDLIKWIVIHA